MNAKQARSWVMYDWANSAFATTMLAAVLPVYYQNVAASNLPDYLATSYWAFTQTAAMILVALLSPFLGAIADSSQRKSAFLKMSAIIGVIACAFMTLVGSGNYIAASLLFIVASLGFSGGNTFYDAMLPDIAAPHERDVLSANGYMYGYIGGGILLAINIAMIQLWDKIGFASETAATQAVFLTVAVWWMLFSIPIFRNIPDPARREKRSVSFYAKDGFSRVGQSIRHLKKYPELLKYMIAFLFFNDGISTIISMATIYGAEIGIGMTHLIVALLITQFVGIPFTYLFGKIAKRIGAKKGLYLSLTFYVVIVIFGYFMQSALHFYILAFMVGIVQGGSQALARSIYSQMVPPARTTEFFGFLSLSSKVSSAAGPAVFGVVAAIAGSSRLAILSVIMFFVVGIILLRFVNIEKGVREAKFDISEFHGTGGTPSNTASV
ncbi:MFS transporter [Paenibacillus sediminis]|uniref:UMF1 family MFS transporter n=1 Tax=Paenibacillus sediminis TaxID=664909 RepID=A0ABS4H6P0_9BACL|nr:MFS transporter [Paenibacillus sediminis]MBP1937897.1 UMF1 family MFS transporter [Paenibacillus sediminis]